MAWKAGGGGTPKKLKMADGTRLESAGADGQWQFLLNDGSEGMKFTIGDYGSDNALQLNDVTGTSGTTILRIGTDSADDGVLLLEGAAAALQFDSASAMIGQDTSRTRLWTKQGAWITYGSDIDEDGGALLRLEQAGDTAEFTGGTGETQYGITLEPEVAQTDTAAFIAINVDVSDTSQGSGEQSLMHLKWATSTQFRVADDGSVHAPNLPTSDPGVAGEIWADSTDGYTLKLSQG